MATTDFNPSLSSYHTALVLLPPREIAERLDQFRRVHDKSAERWPAHFTVQFPFVQEELFSETITRLETTISQFQPFSFHLDSVGKFSLAGYDSVHLTTSDRAVHELWKAIASVLKYSGRPFKPHLTLGQANHKSPEAVALLEEKARNLMRSVASFEWTVRGVLFLKKDESDGGIMKLYHEFFLSEQSLTSYQPAAPSPTVICTQGQWCLTDNLVLSTPLPTELSVLSYNVLFDPAFPFPGRLPPLVGVITTADCDIVCLQEVTDISLPLLLSNLSSNYPYSSRHPDIICENERNILVLSKYPFTWKKINLGSSKHKPAFICTFLGPENRRVSLGAFHLTAGRAAFPLEQKTAELQGLVSYLTANHPEEDWIIAGDSNWPSTASATPADSLFTDAGLAFPHVPTYDPTLNPLAAATVRDSSEPQRYDRLYLKRACRWEVHQTKVLGTGDEPPSDHFALKVILKPRSVETLPESSSLLPETLEPLPDTLLTTSELQKLATKHSVLPSAEQTAAMQDSLETLRRIICDADTPAIQLHLEAIGSFALGTHTTTSDVDTLAVGNIPISTFWSLARNRIRASGDLVKLKRFVKNAIVPRMELEVHGVKMDMQYCTASQLTGVRWKDLSRIPPDSSLFQLPASSLITLNSYRDVLTLRKLLPNLATFRTAHSALKQYLTAQGLCGARFGFLGGFHLTLLLARIALTLGRNAQPHHLVRQFFKTYSRWNWEHDMVWPIPGRESSGYTYRRAPHKEPIVVLSIEKPPANLTFHASHNSLATMSQAFSVADQKLADGKPWDETCGLDDQNLGPERRFLDAFKAFIRLDVHYWGSSTLRGRELIGWLESRIVSLLVSLHAAVPNVHARFWPQRFTDASTDHNELNGFYLFGLAPISPSERDSGALLSALTKCLRTFEEDLHAHEGYHDPTNSTYLSVTHAKRSQLPQNVILDPYTWPDDTHEVFDDDSDDGVTATPDQGEEVPASQRKGKGKAKSTTHVPAPTKLRTSIDIFNRICWDTSLGKDNYLIGYEDRFTGIKETRLELWSREVEDESFIPFHRVVYFKRIVDGVIVWDKRTKVDLIFGSGIGSGLQESK